MSKDDLIFPALDALERDRRRRLNQVIWFMVGLIGVVVVFDWWILPYI